MSSSRTCPGRPRRCSPGPSRNRSTARSALASSARPTSSRRTSRGWRSTTSASATSSFDRARSSPTSCSWTRSTARRRRRSRRSSRRWRSGRSPSTARRVPVPRPFLLLATENPIEYEGTFPLPEAQLDRFFLRTSLGYPSAQEELQVIDDQRIEHPLASLRPIVGVKEIELLEQAVASVYVDPLIAEWIVGLVRATREMSATAVGASVRGSLALERAVTRLGAPARPRVRRPDGRRAPVRRRARPPRRPHADQARRGAPAGDGRGHGRLRGGVPLACAATGRRARRAASEPTARMIGSSLTFPLVSRRRLIGLAFGSMHGARGGARARTSQGRARTSRGTTRIGSTGPPRAGSRPHARQTSSSSASTSPTRRRAS